MKTILLIGKNGQVGWELRHALAPMGRVIALDRTQMDLTKSDLIRKTIREIVPDVIVNAAGYTVVDKAEKEPELAMQVNAIAPGVMAEESKRLNALLVHYSTDYVFDGTRSTPYVEEDEAYPVNVYGKSKLEGERAITAVNCAHLILRTSWIYSARGSNFVLTILRLAREKKELVIVDDQIGSPTSARALALSTAELAMRAILQGANWGVYHLSASGYASRLDFARRILKLAKETWRLDTGWAILKSTTTTNYPLPAQRPLNASTSKELIKKIFGVEMSIWEIQLRQFIEDLTVNKDLRRQLGG